MRTKGTKYDKIKDIGTGVPVSIYAANNNIRNPAYVCVKYDRYKVGYMRNGKLVFAPHPGYDIYCWNGTNVVISEK